jgi:hypothetical protein
MPDIAFTTPDGLTGFARVGNRPRVRCSNKPCVRWAPLRCDFPTPTRKSGTCDKPLCKQCAVSVGEDLDHCPSHPRGTPPGPAQGALPI